MNSIMRVDDVATMRQKRASDALHFQDKQDVSRKIQNGKWVLSLFLFLLFMLI